jgi:hypothetical protein
VGCKDFPARDPELVVTQAALVHASESAFHLNTERRRRIRRSARLSHSFSFEQRRRPELFRIAIGNGSFLADQHDEFLAAGDAPV